MGLLDYVDRSWPVLNRAIGAHTALYRATRGRIGHRLPGTPPMLLLDHVGAKSGTARTTPLVYTADGDDLILVASKGGFPRNPAWYHNLVANPETTVQVGAERRRVRARVAGDAEYPDLWAKAVKTYRGFEDYRRRTERRIPLVVLEPAR
ncbi:MAG TPA: nitroreductase family deazaflavin-dependent oxidoreductase [Solirubrobacterales bacterium]|nr:nitroreductase family deazaflavin-dependent oxidoreductase [Solirubrobacterales bacterium]